MAISKQDSALLILGHGSTENADSSGPTWLHADSIAKTGQFRRVYCSFWKEEPSFRQIRPMIEEEEVYVVPNFISEGYFTKQVIPRELGLTGRTTRENGKSFHYCDPVGIHSGMTGLLTQRATEAIPPGTPLRDVTLIIAGHGTGLNKKSTASIKRQVAELRECPIPFAKVMDAYMEEAPFIADWKTLTDSPVVVVVPFFIANGLHSCEDIPQLLGIETPSTPSANDSRLFEQNPFQMEGRTLCYTPAIGTDPALAEVIVDQVAHFDEHYRS